MSYLKYNGQMVVSGGSYLTSPQLIMDGDGNIYSTVTIGTQTWLTENLKTTKYINGTSIPNLVSNAAWAADTTGAYCWYDNDESTYKDTYGALYNWFVIENVNDIAPTGTRVATKSDWDTLISFLGGVSAAGGPLKDTGTVVWNSPNTGTNTTGFSARGGGNRRDTGVDFPDFGSNGFWWADFESGNNGQRYYMFNNNNNVQSDVSLDKNWGLSIRCIVE